MIQSVPRIVSVRSIAIAVMICIISSVFIASSVVAEKNTTSSGVVQVEVYHFHPNQGCRTCTTIGEYAEELVKKSYPADLESKKMVFDHINFQDPKNADLVKKFDVTGSSLMIGVTDASGFHKEEDIKVWYKVGNKDEFMTYLKDLLDKRLSGNLE